MLQKTLFDQTLKRLRFGSIKVTYWDDSTVTYGTNKPFAGHLILKTPESLGAIIKDADLGFGESYMDGTAEFEGDLHDLVYWALKNKELFPGIGGMRQVEKFLRGFTKSTTPKEHKSDIHHHYDLGNDFFRLFLDPTMTYSCAYYRKADNDLETAQNDKVEHTLRKLRLKPGEKLLDIGCGWGQMILHAAKKYGVTAQGITMAEEQVVEATDRIAKDKLAGSVAVKLEDYREHAKTHQGFYDKIVSVGMFEHVGRPNLGLFLEATSSMLKPGGQMLLHFITKQTEEVGGAFTLKYIFPGGYIPSVRETVSLFPASNFHLLDVENLRYHYSLTLDAWSENYEKNLPEIRQLLEAKHLSERWDGPTEAERFIRMWRLYLRGASAGFHAGSIELHQFLVSKGIVDDLPLTREDWYGTK